VTWFSPATARWASAPAAIYALAAARALHGPQQSLRPSRSFASPLEIAAGIDVYTNEHIVVEGNGVRDLNEQPEIAVTRGSTGNGSCNLFAVCLATAVLGTVLLGPTPQPPRQIIESASWPSTDGVIRTAEPGAKELGRIRRRTYYRADVTYDDNRGPASG